ncbi:MAG: hypothetical protein HQ515_23535, partial [Phycisphaeraceae bacterium]|nr:hypothetical protein [Phycisphaeraceae bacterium]
ASMQKMPWVHVKATVHRAGQTLLHEEWECFDSKISIKIEPDGVISFRDYGLGTVSVYRPTDDAILISPVTDRFNKKGAGSGSAGVQAMISRFESQGSEVVRTATTQDDLPVEVITLKDQIQEITLVLDRDRQVPLTMETVARIPDTGEKVTASAVFAYPDQGPTDIYGLGVSVDAQVIDNRPKGAVQNLIDEVQSRFYAGYGDHIAVLLESWVGDDNELEPKKIIVMRQKGNMKRVDRYNAYNFTGSKANRATLYPLVKDIWPNLTIEDVVAVEDNKCAEYQMIYDGDTSSQRTNFSGQVETHAIRTDLFQMGGGAESLVSFAWCCPSALMMSGSDQQIKPEELPDEPNRPGLKGFRLVTSMHTPDKRLPGTTIKQRINDYWFDPAKDYLLMEHRSLNQADEGDSTFVTRALETAQTASGQWVPKVILTESSYPDRKGGITHHSQEKRIMMNTEYEFKDDVFDLSTLKP